MNRGGRKRNRKFCFPSCFSAPSVWDPEDGIQMDYLSRFRGRSRTVPVVEIAGDGGEGYSPAGNQVKGLGQIFPRNEKNTKAAAQNSTRTPLSTGARIKQSVFFRVSTKFNSRIQPSTTPPHAPPPVQSNRATKPVSPEPNRPSGPAPPPGRPARRFDAAAPLLIVAATLVVMLFFGRLCAALCNCVWFYLLFRVQRTPAAAAAPPPEAAEEVDLDSPEYKKKVVLMGLLERNRYGASGTPMSPMTSPVTATLINC